MNNVQKKRLQDELAAAGASKAELRGLSTIAARLEGLKNSTAHTPPQSGRHAWKPGPIFMIGIPSLLSLLIGMLLVMSAQATLPGNPLYPIQRMSDSVAVFVHPSYQGTVMMKRADQVKELVSNSAPSDTVLATLADYKQLAASYKATSSNYAEFEYCKHSLEQAASAAPAAERQAITSSLESLSNT